jgi:hypothetical protein
MWKSSQDWRLIQGDMAQIGGFQIILSMTLSCASYWPCSPNSTSTCSSPHLSHQVCLIILGVRDPSVGCISGFEHP